MTTDCFRHLECVQRLLAERRFVDAQRELDLARPRIQPERRMKAHLAAIAKFYKGDIGGARRELEDTARAFGPNVNLTRDLMICQYHLQDLEAVRASLTRLELALLEHEPSLSARSVIESEVWLGKFMEEEARLAAAHVFYERALSRPGDPDCHLLALIQMTRWQGLYEPGANLSQLYRELISLPPERVTPHLRAELEHSLMLIELRLIGGDHAWARIVRVEDELLELDRRLLIFDYVEGTLAQDLPLHAEALARIRALVTDDPYECFLRALALGTASHEDKIRDLGVIAQKLTWSSHLRLLCLAANLEANAAARAELNRKIQLILGGLDPRSQELWRKRLKQAWATAEVRVDVSVRARTIAVHGQTVDLAKKKIGMQLLKGLLKKPALSVDEAIALLWQTSFTPEHYHRLRMSTHRLNTLIHEGTGVGKLIEVDSQMVRLRPEVKLASVDRPE